MLVRQSSCARKKQLLSNYWNRNDLHDKKSNLFGCFSALPDGWYRFGSKLFKLIPWVKTWTGAQLYCQSIDGELVSINNEDENEFVSHFIDQTKSNAAGKDVISCLQNKWD